MCSPGRVYCGSQVSKISRFLDGSKKKKRKSQSSHTNYFPLHRFFSDILNYNTQNFPLGRTSVKGRVPVYNKTEWKLHNATFAKAGTLTHYNFLSGGTLLLLLKMNSEDWVDKWRELVFSPLFKYN